MGMDSLQKLREINLRTTKELIKQSITPDVLVIQAAASFETVQNSSNVLEEKLRAWYALYNPEFSHVVIDNKEFVSKIVTNRRKGLLESIGKKEKESMGGELKEKDIEIIQRLAHAVMVVFEQMKMQEAYLEELVKEVCPNVQWIAGTVIATKLLSFAGSLKRLAEMPSSTIQLLGAEKALFRHIKQGAKSPKFGVLHNHVLVQNAKKDLKGKIARVLADKLSIAAKVDFFKGKFIGDTLLKKIEEKFR